MNTDTQTEEDIGEKKEVGVMTQLSENLTNVVVIESRLTIPPSFQEEPSPLLQSSQPDSQRRVLNVESLSQEQCCNVNILVKREALDAIEEKPECSNTNSSNEDVLSRQHHFVIERNEEMLLSSVDQAQNRMEETLVKDEHQLIESECRGKIIEQSKMHDEKPRVQYDINLIGVCPEVLQNNPEQVSSVPNNVNVFGDNNNKNIFPIQSTLLASNPFLNKTANPMINIFSSAQSSNNLFPNSNLEVNRSNSCQFPVVCGAASTTNTWQGTNDNNLFRQQSIPNFQSQSVNYTNTASSNLPTSSAVQSTNAIQNGSAIFPIQNPSSGGAINGNPFAINSIRNSSGNQQSSSTGLLEVNQPQRKFLRINR